MISTSCTSSLSAASSGGSKVFYRTGLPPLSCCGTWLAVNVSTADGYRSPRGTGAYETRHLQEYDAMEDGNATMVLHYL